ncbi:hypothetical protein [Streptosporangium carneum]|uniref:Glycoside hydrolase family 65 N-terminal domain-containing protein n=1 Tax=Streptosporangium carneum TaxID=47481 RepID=A0A9W6MA76_9ACTN|nr:hypothetical protein [Streptosporangium carneum]GLK07014.1 hypothetical protein GCM10017600_04190 [Streptosporangium carneum]
MDPWLLTYDGFDPALEGLRETLTTLGNGYFATRGAVPEARADGVHSPGTYVAGCHDLPASRSADRSTGSEDLLNVPNWLPLTFRANGGDWFAPGGAEILDCRHTLDMRRGVLSRLLRISDPLGRITRIEQRRLVSMDDPHLAALATTFVPENWDGTLEVRSVLDGRVAGPGDAADRERTDPRLVPVCAHAAHGVIELLTRTAASGVEIALAARTTLAGGRRRAGAGEEAGESAGKGGGRGCERGVEEGWVSEDLAVEVRAGDEVAVEKVVALYTSEDRAVTESEAAARSAVVRAGSFEALTRRHARAWERLWQRAHVRAERPEAQQVLNLYVFHQLQAVSPRAEEKAVPVDFRDVRRHGRVSRSPAVPLKADRRR